MTNLNCINKNKSILNKYIINRKLTSEINSSNFTMTVNVSSVNCDQGFYGTVVTKLFLSLTITAFGDYFLLLHFR